MTPTQRFAQIFSRRPQGRLMLMLAACVLAVAGCGFHLSRPPELPFETLYVVAPTYSSLGAELKRYLASNSKTHLVDRPEQAQVTLQIFSELQESQILALSVAGRVNELQLRFRLTFSVLDRENREWVPRSEVLVQRDMTYDDQTVLAKENEMNLLIQDMRQDAVRQIVRRLARARAPS
jgi:LPS-assembly lipoprotein